MAEDMEDFMGELGKNATFHGAMPKQWRFHMLWEDANNFSRNGQLVQWKVTLDALYRELIFIMTKEEGEMVRKPLVLAVEALRSYNDALRLKRKGSKLSMLYDTAYMACSDYEVILRQISGGHGLDMPKAEDPRYAFRRGMG